MLLRSATLGVARDAQRLMDRRLKRDAALRMLPRDDEVERRAWAAAG
jgi:hypothetical protein